MLKRGKRIIASILSMVLFANICFPTFAAALPVAPEVESYKVTDGELVSYFYADQLSDAEKALLSDSTLVDGDEYTIIRPTAADGLVTVDQESKTIKAVETVKGEFKWIPTAAYLVEEGKEKVAITLTNGEGTFAPTSDNYSIEVVYTFKAEVDVDGQKVILGTPAVLKEGVDYLKDVKGVESALKLFQDSVPTLIDLGSTSISLGYGTLTMFQTKEEDKAAINSFKEQMNGDNELTAYTMVKGIPSGTAGILGYMLTTGERVDLELITLYNQIETLSASFNETYNTIKSVQAFIQIPQDYLDNAEKAKVGFDAVLGILDDVAVEQTFFTAETAVKDGVDTTALAAKVDALTTTAGKDITPVAEWVIDETTIEASVNLVNITVVVNADVIKGDVNSNELVAKPEYTETFKVTKGTTKAEYTQLIEDLGIVNNAFAAWGLSLSNMGDITISELPAEAGDEDFTISIKYLPKVVKITEAFEGGVEKEVYYGYVYGFAKHPVAESAYIYKVTGESRDFEQGETYVVKSDVTVTRGSDRAKTSHAWNTLVANALSEVKAQNILKAEAVKSNGSIRVKHPNNNDNLAKADATGESTTVTAVAYDAGYNGLAWEPVTAVAGNKTATFVKDGNKYVATFDSMENDIKVEYRLTLTNADAKTIATLPHVLATEAAQQISELNDLLAYKGTIDSNAASLNVLSLVVTADNGFSAEAVASYKDLQNKGMYQEGENVNMLLSRYLGEYASNGLVYFYTGGNKLIKEQVELLRDFLVILNKAENEAALRAAFVKFGSLIPDDMQVDDILAKFGDVIAFLDDYQPCEINANIDVNSAKLADLVAALTATGTTKEYTTAPAIYLSTEIVPSVSGKVTVTLVQVINGVVADSRTMQVNSTVEFTDAGFANIDALWAEMEAVIDTNKYELTNKETEGAALVVGQIPTGNVTYTREWTPVEYTVEVPGQDDVKVDLTGSTVQFTLPAPTDAAQQFTYTIEGYGEFTLNAGDVAKTIILTVAEFEALLAGGKVLNVTVKVEDVSTLNFIALAKKMNTNIGNANSTVDAQGRLKYAFMPFEVNGEKVLVMRNIYAGAEFDMNSIMTNLGMAFADYGYIALGDNVVWNGAALSLQGMVNAFIDGGLGMDTFRNVIDANGNIVELNLTGEYLLNPADKWGAHNGVVASTNVLGGKLIETTLTYGTTEEKASTVKFYITLEDFDAQASALKQLDSALGAIAPYVNINSIDGKLDVVMNMPETVYKLYLTYMLLEQEITFDNFNDVDLETLLSYVKEIGEDVVTDLAAGENADAKRFFTTMAIENTIKQFVSSGMDLDAYGATVKKLVKVLNHILTNVERNDVVYSGSTVTTTLRYADLESVFGSINPLISSFISDKEMAIDAKLTLKNVENEYDAYVIDLPDSTNVGKADLLKLFNLTSDVTGALNSVSSNSYIMLLNDVTLTKDVTIKGDNVIIDLNGFDITGNLNATGTGARIVDNTLTTKGTGVVTGNVTGNFTIYAGKYTADVTAMLPAGHVVEDGYVRNEAYLLNETDTEYQIILNSDIFNTDKDSAMHSIVNAVFNVATNFIGYNTVKVDGQNLVSLGENSLFGLVSLAKGGRNAIINEALSYVYPKAVEHITNGVLASIADLEALATSNGAIYSVGLTLNPWDILYTVEGGTSNDAYFSVGYKPDEDNAKSKALAFYLEDEAMKELAAAIGEVLVVNKAGITLGEKVVYNGGTSFSLEHSGEFDVAIDFSKDANYSIAILTLLANNAANKAPYTAAVNAFIEKASIAEMKKLVDNATFAQYIAAFKAANGKDFAAMVDAMGYADSARVEEIKALEGRYSLALDLLYKVLSKVGITGPATKLGAFASNTDFGAYSIEGSKFGVTAKLALKIFSNKPEVIKLIPSIQGHEEYVNGYYVIENDETGYVVLDVAAEGITVNQFANFIKVDALFAEKVTVNLADGATAKNLEGADVVVNGAQFTVVAENAGGRDEKSYTVIILGDTNSNGRVESGDATRIKQDYLGKDMDRALTDLERFAGDVNWNDRLESGDASQIQVKRMEFQGAAGVEYTSKLSNYSEKVDVATDALLGMIKG